MSNAIKLPKFRPTIRNHNGRLCMAQPEVEKGSCRGCIFARQTYCAGPEDCRKEIYVDTIPIFNCIDALELYAIQEC